MNIFVDLSLMTNLHFLNAKALLGSIKNYFYSTTLISNYWVFYDIHLLQVLQN